MSSPLHQLSRPALLALTNALARGRLPLPCTDGMLANYVPAQHLPAVEAELNQLYRRSFDANQLAILLQLLADERANAQQKQDQIDLVWTGEEILGTASRDTRVVVQELFSIAQHSVLIASYALDSKHKAYELFKPLAQRMDTDPGFSVRMFVNVKRNHTCRKANSILLREFEEKFRDQVWPGTRSPEVFYDPRSLSTKPGPKACLHAKCVVVDEEHLLITSANFTEAAHQRNIEAGVVINDPIASQAMCNQFEMLVARNILKRVPGLG